MSELNLTPKQEKFCLEYLKTGNASEAYRTAYDAADMKPESIHRNAYELVNNTKIASRLAELNASAVSDAVMTRQEAMEKLSNLARTDLADVVEFSSCEVGMDGETPVIQATWKIKDSAFMNPKQLAIITELSAGREGIKIKTHSQLAAIQQLAKMQGWESATKHDHISSDGSMTPRPAIDTSKLSPATIAELMAAKPDDSN